jgi:hypothetical protein
MYMQSEVQSVRNRVKGPMAGRKYVLGSGNGVQSLETTGDRVRSSREVRIPLHNVLRTLLWDITLWTQLLFSHNSEETESLQYVSRCLRQDGLIFTQNLADVLYVQDSLLKCLIHYPQPLS